MASGSVAAMVSQLRQSIIDGQLTPGDQLPSTRALMAEYNLSDNAVYRAIAILKAEGYAISRQGKGVFAAMPTALISGERRIHAGITEPGEEILHKASVRITPPAWVSALLDSERCVNRVRTVVRGEWVVQASQSWVHLDVTEHVPEVDEPRPCNPSWQALYEARTGNEVDTMSEVDTRLTSDTERLALNLDRPRHVLVLRSVYRVGEQVIGVGEGVYAPGYPLKIKS